MYNDETIRALIAKYVSGEASPEDAIEVEAWAHASPENKTYLEGCFRIVHPLDSASWVKAKTQVWKGIEVQITPATKTRTITKRLWPIGIAASLLLVVAIAFLLTNQHSRNSSPLTYTASTDTKNIQLADGTEITLAPFSRVVLEENYGDTSRQLTLQGSATFVVHHNEAKPFVVAVDRLRIKDIGTRFTVTNLQDSDKIDIAVQEGVVLLTSIKSQSLTLTAGETAAFSRSSGSLEVVEKRKTNVPSIVQNERPSISKQMDTPVTYRQPLNDTSKTSSDSVLILSAAEAQKILGGSVRLTNNDKNGNDGLLTLTRQYRLLSDASVMLSSGLEYFGDQNAARNAYERFRVKFPAAKDVQELKTTSVDAFESAEGSTYYLVVVRKQNILLQARINKPPSKVSTLTLLQTLKAKAHKIK